uniref:Uncharacterized protein n=1 Tax=Ixodes ricinus TaxID=34613 RepID=A0A6B0UMZ0_IXORI
MASCQGQQGVVAPLLLFEALSSSGDDEPPCFGGLRSSRKSPLTWEMPSNQTLSEAWVLCHGDEHSRLLRTRSLLPRTSSWRGRRLREPSRHCAVLPLGCLATVPVRAHPPGRAVCQGRT